MKIKAKIYFLFFMLLIPIALQAQLECTAGDEGNSVLVNSKSGKALNADKSAKSLKRKRARIQKKLKKQKKGGSSKKVISKTKKQLKKVKKDLSAANKCKGQSDGDEGRIQLGDGDAYIVARYFIHDAAISNKGCSVVVVVEFDDMPGTSYSKVSYLRVSRTNEGRKTVSTAPPYDDVFEFAAGFIAPNAFRTFKAPVGKHQVVIHTKTLLEIQKAKLADCEDSVLKVAEDFTNPELSS